MTKQYLLLLFCVCASANINAQLSEGLYDKDRGNEMSDGPAPVKKQLKLLWDLEDRLMNNRKEIGTYTPNVPIRQGGLIVESGSPSKSHSSSKTNWIKGNTKHISPSEVNARIAADREWRMEQARIRREEERRRKKEEDDRREMQARMQHAMLTAPMYQAAAERDHWHSTEGARILSEIKAKDLVRLPTRQEASGAELAAGIKPKSKFQIDPHATVRIYEWHSDDFKWINPDRIKPVKSSGREAKAWKELRRSCSEQKFQLLAHSLIALNGGTLPTFLGYNKGNLVLLTSSNDDFVEKEKLFVVSPNGSRITVHEFENHDGEKENILYKMNREENLIDVRGDLSGLGFKVEAKETKGKVISGKSDVQKDFSVAGRDFSIKSEKAFSTKNLAPKADVKIESVLVDNSVTYGRKEVFISDYFAIETGYALSGGVKATAGGKVELNLATEKKASLKADIGAELVKVGGNVKVSFVKSTNGNDCIVSTEARGNVGIKVSPLTVVRSFLDWNGVREATITPVVDLKKQIPGYQ